MEIKRSSKKYRNQAISCFYPELVGRRGCGEYGFAVGTKQRWGVGFGMGWDGNRLICLGYGKVKNPSDAGVEKSESGFVNTESFAYLFLEQRDCYGH